MRLCHISDTHGQFPTLYGSFDAIVHSGDMLIDAPFSLRKLGSPLIQRDWIRSNAEKFRTWIGSKPFLFSSGNHDYMDPCSELRDIGINAINLDNKIVELDGYKFYGFPYVPYIGVWNWELDASEMQKKVLNLVKIINAEKIDVIVAHCPPRSILDLAKSNTRYGNQHIFDSFKQLKHLPKLYLCGHIHFSNGLFWHTSNKKDYMMISNAATTQRVVELT